MLNAFKNKDPDSNNISSVASNNSQKNKPLVPEQPKTHPECLHTYTPLPLKDLLSLFSKQNAAIGVESVRAWVIVQIICERVYAKRLTKVDNKRLFAFVNKKNATPDEAFLQAMVSLGSFKSWAEFYRQGAVKYYAEWLKNSEVRRVVKQFDFAAQHSPLAQSMKSLTVFMYHFWPKRYSYPCWNSYDVHHYSQIAKDKSLPSLEKLHIKNSPFIAIAKSVIWRHSLFYDKKTLTGFKNGACFYQQLWIDISEAVKKYDLPQAKFEQAQLIEYKSFCCEKYNFLNGYPSPLDFLEQYAKDSDPSNLSLAWYPRFYRMLQSYIGKESNSLILTQWYLLLADFLNTHYMMCVSAKEILHIPELETPFDAVYECTWCIRRIIEILEKNYSGLPILTGHKKQDFKATVKEYEDVDFDGWDFEKGRESGHTIYQYHMAVAKRSYKDVQRLIIAHPRVVVNCIVRRDRDAILGKKNHSLDSSSKDIGPFLRSVIEKVWLSEILRGLMNYSTLGVFII